jgi:hypothetical protein
MSQIQVTAKDVYDQYRRQIEHEDNLVSQRSSWVLIAQSFLVVGYCIMHQNTPPDAAAQPLYKMITDGISYVGFITLIPILLGIVGSIRVMRALNRRFGELRRQDAQLEGLMTHLPPIQSRGTDCLFGQLASVLLPLLFLLFWTVMTLAQWRHPA